MKISKNIIKIIFVFLIVGFFIPHYFVSAHVPVMEPIVESQLSNYALYFKAVKIDDPIKKSQAIYGRLSGLDEFDVYAFTAESDAQIPVSVLVPNLKANSLLQPQLYIVAKDLTDTDNSLQLPFELPQGYKVKKYNWDQQNKLTFEPYSLERLRSSKEVSLNVHKNQNYFLVVKDSNHQIGNYVLAVGDAENFSGISPVHLFSNLALIKLGLYSNTNIPWLNILGLFLFIAGFIVGLGAVTVIDFIGFLGRKSSYWTEVAIKAHHVTKPLIWLGILLLVVGAGITYRDSWLSEVALFQSILILILIINGLFLSFYISPRLNKLEKDGEADKLLPKNMQLKIFISFIISFLGWWLNLVFLVWYILIQ